jgi:sensor histidine kinase YesM
MRKAVLLFLSLLISASLFAQVQTVVSGKIQNQPDKNIALVIFTFNVSTMNEDELYVWTKIQGDSTFRFSTDKITKSYTHCRLQCNNETLKIFLSPGDTLMVETEYNHMGSSAVFTGRGSDLNNYLKQSQLRYSENIGQNLAMNFFKRDNKFVYMNILKDDPKIVESLIKRKNEKLSWMHAFFSKGLADTSFLQLESNRFEYQFYIDLINPDIRRSCRDSAYFRGVREILGTANLTDNRALVDFKEYRDFIKGYVDFRVDPHASSSANLLDHINLAKRELTGMVKTFCIYSLIEEAIHKEDNVYTKSLLKEYFVQNNGDREMVSLLDSIDLYQPWTLTDTTRTNSSALSFSLTLFFYILIVLIVFVIFKTGQTLRKKGKWPDPMVLILSGICLFGLLLIINYLVKSLNSNSGIFPILNILVLLGFMGIQVGWLIPAWFYKKKYFRYGLLLILFSICFVLILKKIGYAQYIINPKDTRMVPSIVSFILHSWLFLVSFSFLFYYMCLLVKEKKSARYLFSDKRFNWELFINAIMFISFLTAVLSRLGINSHQFRDVVIFLLGATVFYVHTFFLIPRLLMKDKIGSYLFKSLVLIIGCSLIIILQKTFQIQYNIYTLGVRIPWPEMLILPETRDFLPALTLQLIIIPALIYVSVRKQIVRQIEVGKMFRTKEAELQQLRSQVNPHFLFNSLNTVYAFALKENNPKTAEYIAKLANLMRYLIEDMDKEKIFVVKEIEYIRDYINLQSVRSSVEHKIDVKTDIQDPDFQIAPMLMIPFVENAFKHGMNPGKVSELRIFVQVKDNRFVFEIENSTDRNFEAFYKEKGFGIGIENVRQRLELIYPGKNSLSISAAEDRFKVVLIVNLD